MNQIHPDDDTKFHEYWDMADGSTFLVEVEVAHFKKGCHATWDDPGEHNEFEYEIVGGDLPEEYYDELYSDDDFAFYVEKKFCKTNGYHIY